VFDLFRTRQPSLYGQRLCHEIASALAEAGFCIVSGMARGIDSIAHRAALSVGGETIAFLGCGLDIIYPPENLNLYREISEKGGVLSEFSLGRKADKRTFPMRNRLVSGISSATIVIESAASGGSLITAQFAAEQGRQVFALPGRVDQPESAGCNQLIRDGAILVRNVQDILDEMENSFLLGMTFSKKNAENPLQKEQDIKSSQFENFIPEEREVFSILKDGSCLSLEEMFERVSLEFSKLSSTLSMMEINGVLEKRSDGKFELK
jgi:DNA processing protein